MIRLMIINYNEDEAEEMERLLEHAQDGLLANVCGDQKCMTCTYKNVCGDITRALEYIRKVRVTRYSI